MTSEMREQALQAREALQIVTAEQDQLAEAFQEQQRQQGIEYSYFDALDMVIGKATHDPETFLREDLPALREIARQYGGVLFEDVSIG